MMMARFCGPPLVGFWGLPFVAIPATVIGKCCGVPPTGSAMFVKSEVEFEEDANDTEAPPLSEAACFVALLSPSPFGRTLFSGSKAVSIGICGSTGGLFAGFWGCGPTGFGGTVVRGGGGAGAAALVVVRTGAGGCGTTALVA
ncbi:hypothetical protein BDR26DRAFT_860167 [Obelidium mucronatum]|nr:hypothetical protein BDR26DRAFT_860167 [Obelidium mucronatum]